jgi:type 2 lantibiotic biosynthesis protein LanM
MLDRGLAGFLVDYPVLAHQLVVIVTSWVERTTELIMRIDADRVALAHTFGAGIATGDVVAIAPALSDPHHGRARVCAVTFGSGLEVVYKPRSVAIEAAFGDLLAWMAPGVAHAPRGLRTLDRATHGWVEFARQGSFANRAHVAAYYYRAGVLLCVTSVLGARDLHRDNVVATSDGPALVDLEMLLQPVLKSAAAAPDAPAGERAAECLATGLLSLIELTPEGEAHDAGGLRGERTGALPFPRRAWLDAGTDALRPIDEPVFSVSGVHEVVLDDVVQRPESWADEIRHGFRDAYRCLLARRDDMLRPDGPLHDFGRCTIRLLPRRTNQYAMLAHLLATPKYQADGIVASCAIDVLHRGYASDESRPELWDVAVEERRAMLALDVPYFSMACDGLDAAAEGRTVAKHYYAKSALDAARDRVRALSEVDLRDQMAVLSRALGESVASRFAAAPFPAGQDDAATFVGCAEWIGRELLSRRGGRFGMAGASPL